MLTSVTHRLDNAPKEVFDLDIAPSGNWIATTEVGKSQHLSFGGKQIALSQNIRFPMVRALGEDLALIVDSRAGKKPNGWIIDSSGEVIRNFYAGDAIEDVLVSDRYIVISYFDESACSSSGIEGNGVAVFDEQGNYLFGYREIFGDQAVNVYDCYCTCWTQENWVLFFPYMEFPLVSFDLENKSQQIYSVPDELRGSNAISCKDNTVFFHSPYDDENGIYRWTLNEGNATRIGGYSGRLRGLTSGRFLAIEKSGYTIVAAE